MSFVRIESPLSGEQLLKRMDAIGLGQRTLSRRIGVSYQQLHCYVSGKLPVPAVIHHALLCEEMVHALLPLVRTPKTCRVSKLKLRQIVAAASEPITVQPHVRKQKSYSKRRNLLAPRYFPKPPPGIPADLPPPPLWVELAARIGQKAADDLHAKLANQRPQGPRRGSEDHLGDGQFRTTDPI